MHRHILLTCALITVSVSGLAHAQEPPLPPGVSESQRAQYNEAKEAAVIKLIAEDAAKAEVEKAQVTAADEAACKSDPNPGECKARRAEVAERAKKAEDYKKKIEALKPPAELAKQLETMPSGLRLGASLMGHLGETIEGNDSFGLQLRPVFMPYLSWHPTPGNVSAAYCAARKYGRAYAQAVADDYAIRLKQNADDPQWDEGDPGQCSGPRVMFGGYFGIALPYRTNLTRGDRPAAATEVRFIASLGLAIQYDVVALLLGPTFSMVERSRTDLPNVLEAAYGFMFGIGTSFGIGSSVLK